jgi:hypothetical protein
MVKDRSEEIPATVEGGQDAFSMQMAKLRKRKGLLAMTFCQSSPGIRLWREGRGSSDPLECKMRGFREDTTDSISLFTG